MATNSERQMVRPNNRNR